MLWRSVRYQIPFISPRPLLPQKEKFSTAGMGSRVSCSQLKNGDILCQWEKQKKQVAPLGEGNGNCLGPSTLCQYQVEVSYYCRKDRKLLPKTNFRYKAEWTAPGKTGKNAEKVHRWGLSTQHFWKSEFGLEPQRIFSTFTHGAPSSSSALLRHG